MILFWFFEMVVELLGGEDHGGFGFLWDSHYGELIGELSWDHHPHYGELIWDHHYGGSYRGELIGDWSVSIPIPLAVCICETVSNFERQF